MMPNSWKIDGDFGRVLLFRRKNWPKKLCTRHFWGNDLRNFLLRQNGGGFNFAAEFGK